MRSTISGFSLLLLALSILILFKAFNLPVFTPSIPAIDPPMDNIPVPQDNSSALIPAPEDQKPIVPESDTETQNFSEEQNNQKTIVSSLEAAIAQLENKLASTEKALKNITTVNIDNQPRTLTVFGGQTFRSGVDVINDATIPKIEKLINELSVFPNSSIIIEGHTDNIPTGKLHKDNLDLSISRARSIANMLISRGISEERISVIGYGDTRPISPNSTEEGRAKNRRVEVKLMFKEEGN